MLKRPITYKDFEDREVTEEFYFNLSKAELIEMEVEHKQGFAKMIEDVIKAEDRKQLIAIFKDLVLRSYGIKSEDGKRFIKSPQLCEEFSQTEAYSTLFMELATDDKAAATFIKGIMPSDLAAEIEKEELKQGVAANLTAATPPAE